VVIKLISIAVKELKIISRDPVGVAMLFVLPAVFILVLSVALQGAFSEVNVEEKFRVLVVNHDPGDFGPALMEALEKSGRFEVVTRIDGRKLTDEMAARQLEEGTYSITISIPKYAEQAILLERDEKIQIGADPVLSSAVVYAVKSSVENFVSMVMVETLLTKQRITEKKYAQFLADARSREKKIMGQSQDKLEPPSFEAHTQSTNYLSERGLLVNQSYISMASEDIKPNEVQQNVPGWTVFGLFWIAQMLALSIVNERQSGSYKRILISPITLTQYIVGKVAPFIIVNIVQAVFMFAIGAYVLPLFGCAELVITNVPALFLVTLAISVVSISFGLFMGSMSKSGTIVASVTAAVLIIMCVIGGVMVPKFVMPSFMQKMSLFVPQGWAVDGYQDILVRGYGVPDILPALGILMLFALGFFVIGMVRLNRLAKN
jgi:ABC-2 type transport system permease protein